MKYALIKDTQVLQYHDFGQEQPPELSLNKGKWVPYTEESQPTTSDAEIAESVITITDAGVHMGWVVRLKTAIELWDQPDYKLKIVAPIQLFGTDTGKEILLWYQLKRLPFEAKGEQVHLYCNRIDNQHIAYVNQLTSVGMIEVWEKVDNEVIQIYSIQ